jgi:hypothetical protein
LKRYEDVRELSKRQCTLGFALRKHGVWTTRREHPTGVLPFEHEEIRSLGRDAPPEQAAESQVWKGVAHREREEGCGNQMG